MTNCHKTPAHGRYHNKRFNRDQLLDGLDHRCWGTFVQIPSNKKRGASAVAGRRFAGRASRALLGCVSVAAMVAMAGTSAKAEDQVTIKEIRELKAHLRMLEKRLDKQAQVQKRVLRHEAAYAPGAVEKGPYTPPMPWDKKFHLNGITITPGGFFAAEGVWRSRNQGADIGDVPFGSILPLSSPLAHTNELRFSARQSRVSALVQGYANPDVLVSGYGELDFLGAGNTANSNESNSYNLRIRHMYATVDWMNEGWHMLAGQNWSLATLQGQGITPRNEVIPLTIDAQYVAGFTWTRQPGLRVTKNFGDSLWFAASAEMPQTAGIQGCGGSVVGAGNSFGSATLPTGVTALCNEVSGGGGLLNQVTTYSLNHVPDIIAKTAWEPTIGDRRLHLEAMGMYTDLYDRVSPGATASPIGTNKDTAGWGVGGGVILPLMPKLVDLTGSALYGRGIGRYGSGGLSDATFNADGSLNPLPEVMFLTGATIHATPQLDLYANGGAEKILSPQYFPGYAGYGNPAFINNTGCSGIGIGACTGLSKDVWEVTGGFWDKVYDGAFGSLRVGMQYAYIKRDFFAGTGGLAAGAPALGGSTNENAAYASIRYYPFDAPPAPALQAKY